MKIEYRLRASKDGRANGVAWEWVRISIDHTCVPTVSQSHFAEARRIAAIIDEDVIGFDVYDAVSNQWLPEYSHESHLCEHNPVREGRQAL